MSAWVGFSSEIMSGGDRGIYWWDDETIRGASSGGRGTIPVTPLWKRQTNTTQFWFSRARNAHYISHNMERMFDKWRNTAITKLSYWERSANFVKLQVLNALHHNIRQKERN